jgi:hypothetical protein
VAGSRVLTRSRRAVFFGVGIDHGEASALSSAKSDDVDVAAGVTSSPKRDFELSDEFARGDSIGGLPNRDIIKRFRLQYERHAMMPIVVQGMDQEEQA